MLRKYAEIFCWKNVSSFCIAKATHIFSAKIIRIWYIESTKTVNEMTLNELVKLTMLWTTGPWMLLFILERIFCIYGKYWHRHVWVNSKASEEPALKCLIRECRVQFAIQLTHFRQTPPQHPHPIPQPPPHTHTIYWKSQIFNFRYVRLSDLDILREKWLNYLPSE